MELRGIKPDGPTHTEHALNADQTKLIAKHLALVFIHEIDPSMPSKKLDDAHAGKQEETEPAFMRPPGPGEPIFRC
jgi:hypothetical protein